MSIAVFFSGRCNGYEHTIEKLQERFFRKYDIDFYWSIDEEEETEYYEKLRAILKPKDTFYKQIDKKIINVPLSSQETRQRNTLSMFFHNFQCSQMIDRYMEKTGKQYRAIVRFRLEIESDSEFTLEESLRENTVYIPHGYNYRGVSDRIAYGTVSSMMVYCSLYLYISNYVFCKQAIFNPEYLLMFHINENNMSLIRFPYTYKLHAARHKIMSKNIEKQQDDFECDDDD